MASSSASAGESYIGSLISVTSKSEIRYEGVLATINPQDSTLALHSVRSYGTEGRRKEGPQVPPSDKVYEYILFRGSDIKDLQVKSSPIHTKPQEYTDPAIIQSHYAYAPTSASSASVGNGTLTDSSSYAAQSALSRQSYADAYPLYQTGVTQGLWVSSPASTSTSGPSLITPMYWQGYTGMSSGLALEQQQSVPLQPSSLMLQNQVQYLDGLAPTSMPNFSEPIKPLTFPPTVAPQLAISNPADVSPMLSGSSAPSNSLTTLSFSSSNQELLASVDPISSKSVSGPSSGFPFPSLPQSSSMMGLASGSATTFPSLLNPEQLMLSGPAALSSNQKLCPESKDAEASFPPSLNETSSSMPSQAALLPLPQPSSKHQHGVPDFTEEFDFTAMNEKFNKDEVWGTLGKAKQKGQLGDGSEDNPFHDKMYDAEGHDYNSKIDSKSVYSKDDFFDTLSCTSLNRGAWSRRTKFSERMKLDTETFGDFRQKPLLGRGNQGANFRGSYNRGRGYGYYGGRRRGVYRP